MGVGDEKRDCQVNKQEKGVPSKEIYMLRWVAFSESKVFCYLGRWKMKFKANLEQDSEGLNSSQGVQILSYRIKLSKLSSYISK